MMIAAIVIVAAVASAARPRAVVAPLQPRPESDLRDADKSILIMTTASVPWLTGTAINPLLRAAHLARPRAPGAVVLFLPWLEPEDQEEVYGATAHFDTRADHAAFVRQWLIQTAGLPAEARKLRIAFYDSHFHRPQGSIYPMGRTVEWLGGPLDRYHAEGVEADAWSPDVVVLEEPEHLNWYSYVEGAASAWRRHAHVVGVVHTNYPRYALTERAVGGPLGELVHPVVGPFKMSMALVMARWMTNGHCHRIIKLSRTLPRVGNDDAEVVSNVHGVRGAFLAIGAAGSLSQPFDSSLSIANPWAEPNKPRTAGAYFVGKLMWQKGLDHLAELLTKARKSFGGPLPGGPFHVVGDGEHREAIEARFRRNKVDCIFHGRKDHADALCQSFRVLVNPSTTEVLCTTVAEALAMGKWVVIRRHPSNEFFYDFPTCLPFSSAREFAEQYAYALRHEPPPLSGRARRRLGWAAATDRFCDAALMPASSKLRFHQRLACFLHVHLGKRWRGDVIRSIAGAGLTVGRQFKYVRARQADRPAVVVEPTDEAARGREEPAVEDVPAAGEPPEVEA